MMRKLLATAVLIATTSLACANAETSTLGTGGAGGAGGDGGTTTTDTSGDPTTTSTGSGATGGGGGGSGATGGTGGEGGTTTTTVDDCGNGVKDDDEQCEGEDFGGKTCESIGFSGGFLQCNNFCAFVLSGCTPKEKCSNNDDDDQDGLPDCLDPDCAEQDVCLDSCAAPILVALPYFNFTDTTGRPAVQSSSCSAAEGSEIIYQLTASQTVDMTVTVWSFDGNDFTLSVRTSCSDAATELGCANNFGPNDFTAEQMLVPLTQGQTYYVIVDGATVSDFGFFQIEMQIPKPEADFECGDHFDNDVDGYLDCDDASACQGSFVCMPGNQPPGAQCFNASECSATGGDPICLTPQEGFPDGYCSEFCDLMNPVCGGDGICADPFPVVGHVISKNGVCFDTCLTIGDCRPSYDCVDRGLGALVCVLAPENICDDLQDNDLDKSFDCQDDDCKLDAICTGGDKAASQPCTSTGECFSNNFDPVCLSPQLGFPNGYCSQFCDVDLNDCGAGGVCVQGFVAFNAPICLDICINNNECLPGYFCQDIGAPKKVCVP